MQRSGYNNSHSFIHHVIKILFFFSFLENACIYRKQNETCLKISRIKCIYFFSFFFSSQRCFWQEYTNAIIKGLENVCTQKCLHKHIHIPILYLGLKILLFWGNKHRNRKISNTRILRNKIPAAAFLFLWEIWFDMHSC